jgi:hypothetical protein
VNKPTISQLREQWRKRAKASFAGAREEAHDNPEAARAAKSRALSYFNAWAESEHLDPNPVTPVALPGDRLSDAPDLD